MTAEFALALGAATAATLRGRHPGELRVLIGRDTRRSGPMLAAAVAAGLAAGGAEVSDLGVIPTPGVSQSVVRTGAQAGVVISASHNPFADNGIKIFGAHGEKLTDEAEAELEARIAAGQHNGLTGSALGGIRPATEGTEPYLQFLLSHAPYLDGLRVGLDAAHGAAYQIAPRVFQKIGARVDVIHADPNGENINAGCGRTHPEALMARVKQIGLEVGIAFDGDADRALLIDSRGRLVSGDHILAIAAVVGGHRRVVATAMSNLGVEHYLLARGVTMERVQVGDRYVLEALKAQGLTLGGEQSGHILFLDKAPTGDGILTALQVLAAVRSSGTPLHAWVDEIPIYPQQLHNVRVPNGDKEGLLESATVQRALREAEIDLADRGRVLVRASGTEPVIRVMVEAADEVLVTRWSEHLLTAIDKAIEIGAPA